MSWLREYSIDTDFQSGVLARRLHDYIVDNIDTELYGVTTTENKCKIHFAAELSVSEKATLDTLVGNHDSTPRVLKDKNFKINEYQNRLLKKEIWWDTDNGDGTYSDKVEETIYTYSKKKIISKTVTQYWSDGSIYSGPEVWKYYSLSNGNIIMKKDGV